MDFTDLHELTKISDPKKRRPIASEEKWLNLVSLQRMMANYKDQEYLTDTREISPPPAAPTPLMKPASLTWQGGGQVIQTTTAQL